MIRGGLILGTFSLLMFVTASKYFFDFHFEISTQYKHEPPFYYKKIPQTAHSSEHQTSTEIVILTESVTSVTPRSVSHDVPVTVFHNITKNILQGDYKENVPDENISYYNYFIYSGDKRLNNVDQQQSDAVSPMSYVPSYLLYEKINFNKNFKNPCFYKNELLNCLPYAFILGMPKCGTTDLYFKLASHPEVVKTIKEPHWWTRRRFRGNPKVPKPLLSYLKVYNVAAQYIASTKQPSITFQNEIIVDASASTLWDMDYWSKYINYTESPSYEPSFITANVIKQTLPDSKFIVIFRNPVDRLYSDYLYFKHEVSVEDFHNRVKTAVDLMKSCVTKNGARSCAYNVDLNGFKIKVRLRIGMYHIYVEDWLKVFPKERFLFLRLKDYHTNRSVYLDQICQHLNLRPFPHDILKSAETAPAANQRAPEDKKRGSMLPETRKLLEEFYQPYNDRLAQVLNDDRYRWML